MILQRRILALLAFFLATSCASTPDPLPASVPLAAPTLTPFQPLPEATSTPDVAAIPAEPTYTPLPRQNTAIEILPTPLLMDPSANGSAGDFSLMNINNPLTGLPVNDPALLERRPMVIKVANAPDTIRPQSGLTLADVVYEYYIEWGDTRFIAVMYGNDSPKVGPVRSGRYFDEHVARMYNAFLVFKFADPREYSYLKNSTLNEFLVVPGGSGCPPFIFGPDKKRDDYNNFFFVTSEWAACAASKGLDNSPQVIRGGFFSDAPMEGTTTASRIFSYYSRQSYNYWEYDVITHKYFRYQEANDMLNGKPEAYAPLSDAETGLPVNAENIVVIFVPHTFANEFNAKDEVYNIDLIDYGNAFVFRDGFVVPAKWERTDINQPLLLTNLDGSPIYLRPGRTFYEVMGFTSTYTQDGSDWHFKFETP